MDIITLPADPALIAFEFLSRNPHELRYWRDDFIAWNGRHYKIMDDKMMEARIAQFMNAALNEKGTKFVTSKKIVAEVLFQIRCRREIIIDPSREDRTGPDGRAINLIPCRNGILNMTTGELLPHSPDYLIFNTTAFDYNPTMLEPQRWMDFIRSLWPGDDGSVGGSISCLQEIIGYLLSGDGSLQKILLFIGPPRSGKGTIQHVLIELIGKDHCVGVNSQAFGETFGMMGMIGKPVCFLPDQRTSRNGGATTEKLLQISGQDPVTIPRKNKPHWMGVLPSRIVILTNDIPHLPDASGVIATRFMPLVFEESFLGREDLDLFKKLLPEMPQIMNWALQGLRRLRERGQFVITEQAQEMMDKIRVMAAPHTEFLDEYVIADPNGLVVKTTLYQQHVEWCKTRGHKPCSYTVFCPRVERHFKLDKSNTTQPRINGERPRSWIGIRYKDCADQPENQTPPEVKSVFDTLVAEPRDERNARLIERMMEESTAEITRH